MGRVSQPVSTIRASKHNAINRSGQIQNKIDTNSAGGRHGARSGNLSFFFFLPPRTLATSLKGNWNLEFSSM